MDFSRNKFQLQLGLQISIWLLLILGYTLVFNRFIPLQFSLLRGIGNILPIIVLFYGNVFLVKKYFIPKAYGTYLLWGLLLFIFVTIIRTKVNLIPTSVAEIRVVDIVGLDKQGDGGTHVPTTAEVGHFTITKTESKGKGNKRIRFELG